MILKLMFVSYLYDEGVEDGVLHCTDVKVEDLEGELLEQGYYPRCLAGDAFGQRPQNHVGAGDLDLDVGHRGTAAGAEFQRPGGGGGGRLRRWRDRQQRSRARTGAGAEPSPLLLGLQGTQDQV